MLIHPLGTGELVWFRLRPLLEAHGELVARDLPGFGHEPAFSDGRRHSVPEYADVVEDWIAEAGFDRPHVVGCSMGGAIALELGARGVVSRVTAISPAGGATPGFESEWVHHQTRLIRDGARRAVKAPEPLRDQLIVGPTARLLLYTQVGHPWSVPAEYLREATPLLANAQGFDDANASLFDEFGRIDVAGPRLAEVKVPAQILWGSRDACLFPRQGRRVAGVVPGATLRYLPGLGHLSMLEAPATIAELVLAHAELDIARAEDESRVAHE